MQKTVHLHGAIASGPETIDSAGASGSEFRLASIGNPVNVLPERPQLMQGGNDS
jgi:hypothetical protein